MTRLKLAGCIVCTTFTLIAVGCDDDDVQAMLGNATTTQIAAAEIADNTNETASPIQINDLPISGTDTDETSTPSPI